MNVNLLFWYFITLSNESLWLSTEWLYVWGFGSEDIMYFIIQYLRRTKVIKRRSFLSGILRGRVQDLGDL